MAQKETEPDVVQRQRTKGVKGWGIVPNGATQTASERQATLWKEGKRNLRGERNEVAAGERQTGSWKLRGERLKITADKVQPATGMQN